jgi:hypothetical protein
MTNNQNTITATSDDMYSIWIIMRHKKWFRISHKTTRSIFNSFGVETIFDHTGEEMSLYPGVVFDGQQHFRSLGTVRWCTYGYDATAVQPIEFFYELMVKLLMWMKLKIWDQKYMKFSLFRRMPTPFLERLPLFEIFGSATGIALFSVSNPRSAWQFCTK